MLIDKPTWWDEYTYFDKAELETKLSDDAPAEVRQEWEELEALMDVPDLDEEV